SDGSSSLPSRLPFDCRLSLQLEQKSEQTHEAKPGELRQRPKQGGVQERSPMAGVFPSGETAGSTIRMAVGISN
ncbi:hypothetical protein PFISCL1PPCAC_27563, partial [Pristionchus fissidentatus]